MKKRKKPTPQAVKGKDTPPKDIEKPITNPDIDLDPELLFQGISNPKKRRLLAAFAQCGSVTEAAKQAQIHFTSHYKWLKENDNAAYTEAFNRASETRGDSNENGILDEHGTFVR